MAKTKRVGNPVVYLFKKLWKYSQGNRKSVVLYITFFIIANTISFLEPLVVARLLNIVQEQGITPGSFSSLMWCLGALVLINVAFWAFHGPARVMENKNAFLTRAKYKKYLLDGVLAFPAKWHADHHSGFTIDKIEKGTRALFEFSSRTFQIVELLVRMISSYIILSYFNFSSTYIVVFTIVLTVSTIIRFDKILVQQYKTLFGTENKISEKIFDVISNITTVIILRVEKLVSSAMYKKIMQPFTLWLANRKLNETKWFLVAMCNSLMVVLVLGTYFYTAMRTGEIVLIGTVYALYSYVGRISDLFYRFAYMYGELVQYRSSVLNAEEIANEFQGTRNTFSSKLKKGWRELTIQSLNFSYHAKKGSSRHLDTISLRIRNGERIALIGESGSGKTTLLKIIRELYQPQHIDILLDGKQLKDGFASISSDIALIPQDPEIFATTIKENITIGIRHELSYIKKYTDMACFTNVIERLPKKLDSLVFEKGVNLSGGEKQRLALARGLMACEDKKIILLDEPTSSVDTKNELTIFGNIFAEFGDKTIIASVHRLHLLSMFDAIYFFKQGKIIASGSLSELQNHSREFQELWEKYTKFEKEKDE